MHMARFLGSSNARHRIDGGVAPQERSLKASSKFGQARGFLYAVDGHLIDASSGGLDSLVVEALILRRVRHVAVLNSLTVSPSHRGQGHGSDLLRDFLGLAARCGAGATLVHVRNTDPVAPVDNLWLADWFEKSCRAFPDHSAWARRA